MKTPYAHILNRPLGYEIAILLLKQPRTRSEIDDLLPYEDYYETEIERIIDALDQGGILEVVGARGTDKLTLDKDEFSDKDISEISKKAVSRITNPKDGRGKPPKRSEIPEFHYKINGTDQVPEHGDVENSVSMFEY